MEKTESKLARRFNQQNICVCHFKQNSNRMELCIYFCILNTYNLRQSFVHELALNLLKDT